MNYQTYTITSEEEWLSCIAQFPEANFLQSWEWGIFQEKLGHTVFREAVFVDDICCACAQGVVEKARRATYITVAGGPLVTDWYDKELMGLIISEIRRWAMEVNATFIRIRPQELYSDQSIEELKNAGFKRAPMHLTADTTLQLDLTLTPDDLLAQMRKNTRYSIRKAEKLGIIVTQTQDPAKIQEFFDVQQQVAVKQKFIPFTYTFLYEQFKVFAEKDNAVLFHSYSGDQLLASAFIIFYNKEAVYHYGVSTPENASLPGSYACQWAAILEAQRRGCIRYNFWGVAPEDQPDHRFAGVSIFKRGFGGTEVPYIPAQDLPMNMSYWLVWLFETFRRKFRRL